MSAAAITLDASDDVATALRELPAGETVAVSHPAGQAQLRPVEGIPAFHKVALHDLPGGTQVRKYGAVIGELTSSVPAGGLVHIHNLRSLKAVAAPPAPPSEGTDP